MVKGTTRQVIMVRNPDQRLFEQAIFLLKEDALEKHGLGERELLEEARRLCSSEFPKKQRRKPHSPAFWLGLGAFPVAAGWLLTILL
ncbi:MAG: translation initiation factor 2 [Oscillospiraceae bacterium]|nr:translation initiation factor 2 [Oscillospiraceae bacterium]